MDNKSGYCFEPVFHGGLDNFYRNHPEGTLVLTTRNVEDWVESINGYHDLGYRFKTTCRKPGYFETHWSNKNVTDADLAQFYLDHVQAVRDFATSHPSLTYIEVSLESEDTGKILESLTGIWSFCWQQRNSKAELLKAKQDRLEEANEKSNKGTGDGGE
jgi:hypothetical protein